jgi:hypothetical protein
MQPCPERNDGPAAAETMIQVGATGVTYFVVPGAGIVAADASGATAEIDTSVVDVAPDELRDAAVITEIDLDTQRRLKG